MKPIPADTGQEVVQTGRLAVCNRAETERQQLNIR